MPLSYHLLPVRVFEDLFSPEEIKQFASLEWSILLDSFHEIQAKRTGNSQAPLSQYYLDWAKQTHIQRWGHMGEDFLEYMNPEFWRQKAKEELERLG